MEQKTVLTVDDDPEIRELLETTLELEGYRVVAADDGIKGLTLAMQEKPALIILDVDMPGMNGLLLCKTLRQNEEFHFTPIIMLTGSRTHPEDKIEGLKIGADEYLLKPFLPEEIALRVKNLIKRTEENISVNPLTKLPGSYTFEAAVVSRIKENKKFAACHIDLDHFKAFNDHYGYAWGDDIIKLTASVLSRALRAAGNTDDTVMHLGGDDFLLLTTPDKVDPVYTAVIETFTAEIQGYYKPEDKNRGYITKENRKGAQEEFPMISLSVAVASNDHRTLNHYAQVVDILSQLKKFAKSQPGNVLAKDRRVR